jgi:UDP-N-acetylmuramoyl-L-alanyl-D-glutamate--2,6-diaminopimelate ligase
MIDFAHTNDALRGLLEAVRPLTRGHVVTVFGCGGDRDVAKRPLMGAVAANMSDRVVLTSDNPRSEQPLDIIADIEVGLANTTTPYVTVPDREEAIMRAIIEADAGDIVVIAGKGHEQYQEIGTQLLPFEDGSVARMALSRRHASTRVG